MRELTEIPALRAALEDARHLTRHLYAHLDEAQRDFPRLPTVNPPAWELAHVGWFQEFWCLRYREREVPLPARIEHADAWLNSSIIPHAQRWELPALTFERALDYLDREFADTLEALDRSTREQRYLFQLALLHEDMHGEALLMSLQTLGLPEPTIPRRPTLPLPKPSAITAQEAEYPGGEFTLGAADAGDFAFDNEKPAHQVKLAPFALSTAQVTNEQFAQFVDAGGYMREQYWTQAGWQWRERAQASAPRDWRKDGEQWMARRFDRWEPLAARDPVMNINAFEAQAYCSFVGKRLPTESEWEFAARAGQAARADRYPWGFAPPAWGSVNLNAMYGRPVAVDALAGTDTRASVRQLLGNTWEWTASTFTGYPGFAPDAYREYSQPWFGSHRVLRGGSFATRARLVHNRFRNFYTPERNDVFAGLRTARSIEPATERA
jgi:iron(II)-dependent oxidoreductase